MFILFCRRELTLILNIFRDQEIYRMAKNAGRKASTEAKKKAQNEAKAIEKVNKRAEKDHQTGSEGKKKDVLYQVRTKRDSDVIKAYITFTYRVLHPGVTGRLIFIGILIAAPSIIADAMWLKVLCLAAGGLLILLGLFRQYISLALTKRNDEAYKKGTEFTYDFTLSDAAFYAGDELFSAISNYKDVTSFFYDDNYYYLGVRNKDLFVLPKSRFTIGDPAEFEDFIYRKSKRTCRWIPDKFSDRMKLRRGYRAMQAEQMEKNGSRKK